MSGRSVFRLHSIMALLLGLNLSGFAQHSNNVRYVNPFIGTSKSNVLTKWGNEGGTYPGAVSPSGAIQLTPETRVTGSRGYDYTDSIIYCFSCFNHHSGFPEGSSGQFYVMPVTRQDSFEVGKSGRHFSHKNELASPGYYKVVFDDDRTVAEATTTTRTGMFRFTFATNVSSRIFIGDAGEIILKTKKVLQFSHGNTVINFNEDYSDIKQVNGGWIVTFDSNQTNNKVIELKLSTSSVSFDGAQNNIDKEIGQSGFDEVRKQTNEGWVKKLSVIDVTDKNEQNNAVFYTALYRSLLIPWVIDDADGRYTGADGKVHQKSGNNQYGGFSPWDTFRSLNPLLTLLYPDKENDVILSMLDVYKQTGHLPTESMTGNHAIPIIVDSYLKGINGFDKELAYKAMKNNIVDPPFPQSDMEIYHQNGYIPFTRSESVTRTVEYAYDDWALSQYAKQVVHQDTDYKVLLNRSYSYRNLLNADELFFLPRNKSDFKLQPGMSGYKEGDKWVYTYFVPQNAKDLINLLGGEGQFAARLDSALSNNVILFDNETVFHLPYLFNQAGKPALTQKWCRRIMLERFSNSPGGLPGNDDLGSTSSWYVFSAMGIYPVCPGRPLYAIGSPLFQSITLHLPNGKAFVINSQQVSAKSPFIQSMSINGNPWQQLTISHSMVTAGGKMVFNMGDKVSNWPLNKNPVELSETKINPEFKFSGCFVRKRSVEPNELLSVKFSIINKGATGTKTVGLLVNGKPYSYKNCLVSTGQKIQDSIQVRLYPIGKSVLKIDGMAPVTVIVKNAKNAAMHAYQVIALTAKPMIRLNEVQQVNYAVQNIGGLKKVFVIPVNINDSVAFKDAITLGPGEKRNIEHHFIANKTGFQNIAINSNKVSYKVYKDNRASLFLDLSPFENAADNLVSDRSGFSNSGHIILVADHTKVPDNKLLFGKNCFVQIPPAASLDTLGETITMMVWVYPTAAGGGLTDIFTKGDTNVLQVAGGKTLTFFAGGWGRGDCTIDLPANWKDHWHHIAGVCSGKTLYVYIDGILKGTTVTGQAANLSVNNPWVLGRNDEFPSERMFDGYIGNAKIFKEALPKEEVFAVFNDDKEMITKQIK